MYVQIAIAGSEDEACSELEGIFAEPMLAVGAYADAMRMIALQREVILFDRFSIMKRWSEAGIFDLYAATRKTDVAEQVHDCLGRLLANVVVEAVKLTKAEKKEIR